MKVGPLPPSGCMWPPSPVAMWEWTVFRWAVVAWSPSFRRLRPPRRLVVPVWDLALVLQALRSAPFEPLAGAGLRDLSLKTAFLLAMASAKRVGELQALSVHESCCRWAPDGSGVTLWPNQSFVPKVPASTRSLQPLRLSRLDPGGPDECLCPVRALQEYVRVTASFRVSDALFVCYSGACKGRALSRQRLSHWVVAAIAGAYKTSGRPLPAGVTCHSTRAVSTSWAAARGVPLETICDAASWSSSTTFARFYRVNVAGPGPLEGVLQGTLTPP